MQIQFHPHFANAGLSSLQLCQVFSGSLTKFTDQFHWDYLLQLSDRNAEIEIKSIIIDISVLELIYITYKNI